MKVPVLETTVLSTSEADADGANPDDQSAATGAVEADAPAVDEVFDEMLAALPDGTPAEPVERARERLERRLADVDGPGGAGADEPSGSPEGSEAGAPARSARHRLPVSLEAVLDRVDTPIFTLDDEGSVVHWNPALQELTGVGAENARSMEMASQAFYPDGRRAQTLADKVLEYPERAHEEFDVERAGDRTLYRDESTMVDRNGVERHIAFSAAPLYEDGEVVGVVEMVLDRTEDVERTRETEALVAELRQTVEALQAGDHDARAEFDDAEYVDESLLTVVDGVNDLARQLEGLSTHVLDQVTEVREDAASAAETAEGIRERAAEQSETMETVSGEVATLSATVEEVASTAEEVAERGDRADDLARAGQESAAAALETMETVEDATDAVVDDIESLHARIGEIDEIAAVINDIAEQTNMLALNASIEAARAESESGGGQGFAVVADEVKSLAEESQQHAADIESTIATVQAETDDTLDSVSRAAAEVDEGIDAVQDAMARLEEIVEAVEEVSRSIAEVADATDDQAASAEEIASMVDEATDTADRVAEDVAEIAETTGTQRERMREVQDAMREHTI